MRRWQTWLVMTAVFFCGVVVGVGGVFAIRARIEARLLRTPDPVAQLVLWRMDRELDLSAEQHRRIATILADGRSDFLAVFRTIGPEVLDIATRSRDRIRAELTPAQRGAFDRLAEQRFVLLRRALAEPGAPPSPPR